MAVHAQPLIRSRTTPHRDELSPSRLARMHAVMRRELDAGRLPGLVTALSRRGEDHVDAMGTIAFGGAPMRSDSLFRLASMTKPVTAVATMILVEECRLRLDDPVDPFLPELANRKVLRAIDGPLDDTVPANRPITVRDLLTFRCGYGEVVFSAPGSPLHQALIAANLPLSDWLFRGSPDEFMKRLSGLPLAHQPGERWLYHMSAEILGVLVARASGKSFSAFLRERVFEPLGMKDTMFDVPASKRDRLVTCCRLDPASGKTVADDETSRTELFTHPRTFESGGGGLVSSAADMLAFGKMLVGRGSHGRERILSRATIEAMAVDQITDVQKALSPFFPGFWASRGWGLGVSVVTRHLGIGERPGRFGWDGTFGTSLYVDPKEELVGVLMTQRVPDTFSLPPIFEDFWTSTYQAIADPA